MQNAMNGPHHNYLLFQLIFVGPKILGDVTLHILFFDLQVKWAVSSPVSAGHLNSVTARCPAPSPGCPQSPAGECKHCANKSLALLTATMPPGVGGGRRPTAGATGQAHSIDL